MCDLASRLASYFLKMHDRIQLRWIIKCNGPIQCGGHTKTIGIMYELTCIMNTSLVGWLELRIYVSFVILNWLVQYE